MHDDSRHFDHRTADGLERRSATLQTQGSAEAYDTAALGYEAADPSLQTAPWREATGDSARARDWR